MKFTAKLLQGILSRRFIKDDHSPLGVALGSQAAEKEVEALTQILEDHLNRVPTGECLLVDCTSEETRRIIAIVYDLEHSLKSPARVFSRKPVPR